MKVNVKQWVDKQYPESWTGKIASRTRDRSIRGKVDKSPGKNFHQRVLIKLTHLP